MAKICNEIKKFPEKGSFVKKGTTIIEAEPFVAVLNSSVRQKRCDHCFKKCKVFRCSGCQYVHYCSRNCQKLAWHLHKVECPNMKRVQPLEVPAMVRMLTRIIMKLKNGGAQEKGYYSGSEYRTFDDLMSHSNKIMADMEKMDRFTTVYTVLQQFIPNVVLPSPVEVLEIFGRMTINSFHVLNNQLRSIGVGIYLGPSIIDHSCRPNTSTIFDGTKLYIRVVRDIPDFDWSKVSVPYIDVLKLVDERREELQDSYFFWCNCERCSNPEPAASAASCPNKKCTNPCFPKDFKCTKCNELFPPNFQEDFELVKSQSRRKLEKLAKDMDHAAKLEISRMGLKEQEGILHFHNMLHVHMLERAATAATELELWEESEIYSKKVLQQYQYYYGDSHPLTGKEHLTLAMVLLNCGKSEEAYNQMKKASEVIKIAFGENHPKMQEVERTAYAIQIENSQFKAG
ncbi:histone-lysine N-methyltransferase SMYD3 [Venturia canescens]|uniref:histone-lysine N-methyltransferase SMYD3 n=1 Tax=Venturia canescens TaxID=32260 RepID=UPI001C9CFA6E|nr:histone-lysine N-methyltransferase SMYD3 [Venturia canescens]XP_043286196.1 histone-lysine N-methyltransferase SMYD3 [Venturia canescens]XP_043286206.1 histone-lysine N-methyltransferase SMYD3 [Venturia canescens]XP_043286213.1 histone-lysine N-methyltransferase SMYD3 [Venturia canescens]XP_043286223.1 histone-lysine N-methyltransferase SMYD3 [Venturia canescens]XP_043286230.1 histone-lysine N-methyltransferase SMYD3 [Venturia canescens]